MLTGLISSDFMILVLAFTLVSQCHRGNAVQKSVCVKECVLYAGLVEFSRTRHGL